MKTEDHRYSDSIAKSWSELEIRDPKEVAELSGGQLIGKKITISVLNRNIIVDFDEKKIKWADGAEVDEDLKVVLLHYLIRAEGKIDGTWASYRDFEGGNLYYSVFQGRALRPLIAAFGEDPEILLDAGLALGGTKASRGDASIDLRFFPYVLINVTAWKGDDEVPSNVNILFDSATGRLLPAEDLAHISADLAHDLIVAGKK